MMEEGRRLMAEGRWLKYDGRRKNNHFLRKLFKYLDM